MIHIWTGLIGGGKTYTAVDSMLKYVASGGVCVTNIDLHFEPWSCTYPIYLKRFSGYYRGLARSYCKNCTHTKRGCGAVNALGVREVLRRYYSWELQDGQLIYLDNEQLKSDNLVDLIPRGDSDLPVQIWLDEAGDFFDTQDSRTADTTFLSLLKHSRHLNVDFYFIIQEYSELNKRIRNQCHYVWKSLNISEFEIPGLGRILSNLPFLGKNIRLFKYSRMNYDTYCPKPVFACWIFKRIQIFSCYETEALHTDFFRNMQQIKNNFKKIGKIKKKKDYSGIIDIMQKPFSWGIIYGLMFSLLVDLVSNCIILIKLFK